MLCWRALNSSRRAQDLAPQRNEEKRNDGGRKERGGEEREGEERRSLRGEEKEEVNRTRRSRLNNKIDNLFHSVSLVSLECQYAIGQLCSHLQPTQSWLYREKISSSFQPALHGDLGVLCLSAKSAVPDSLPTISLG